MVGSPPFRKYKFTPKIPTRKATKTARTNIGSFFRSLREIRIGNLVMVILLPHRHLRKLRPLMILSPFLGEIQKILMVRILSQQLKSLACGRRHLSEIGVKTQDEPEMFFVQLPASLPFLKQAADATKGKEKVGSLQDLPAGFMGKMLVYGSRVVRMKLGDTIFDVSAGEKRNFAQAVAAINTKEKHFCELGRIGKTAVVTPELDSGLTSYFHAE